MVATGKQIIDFLKLCDKIKHKNIVNYNFLDKIPSFSQKKMDIFETKENEDLDYDIIIETLNIDASENRFEVTKNDFSEENKEFYEDIFVIQLVYESLCLYALTSNINEIQVFHLFVEKFSETNKFDKNFGKNISLALCLFLKYYVKFIKIPFSEEMIIPFCQYLESSPNLTIDSSKAIYSFFQCQQIQQSPEGYNFMCQTVTNIINERVTFLDFKDKALVDIFVSKFNKYDRSSLNIIADLSNYVTSNYILQLYSTLPYILAESLSKNAKTNNENDDEKIERNSASFSIPHLFPPLDFSLIENTVSFEGLFEESSIKKLSIIATFLGNSSPSALMTFIKAFEKFLIINCSLPVLGGYIFILSQMTSNSKVRMILSSLLSTRAFDHKFCIFKTNNRWINLMRNVIFTVMSKSDPMQFLIVLSDASDDLPLFAEYVLRIYYHWGSNDYTVFSHPHFIKMVLSIDKTLRSETNIDPMCGVILYTFMFDLLQREETSSVFFSITPEFYDDFLVYIFDERLQSKAFYSINFYLKNTLKAPNTTFCDYIIENNLLEEWNKKDPKIREKMVSIIIENMILSEVVNQSFQKFIHVLVNYLTVHPDNILTPLLMSYFSQRTKGINNDELLMINKHIETFDIDERFKLRMWEIAAASSSFANVEEIYIFEPFILPLLFNVYDSDELIALFMKIIDFSFVNLFMLHDGVIDLILLKYLDKEEDVFYRGCNIHLNIKNILNCRKLIETIMRAKSDNSIVSFFIDAFHPENIHKNSFLLSEICNNALADCYTKKSPLLSIGHVPTQMITNIFDSSIFQTGFTLSLRIKVSHTSSIGHNMKITLFKISDTANNSLRVFISVNGINVFIKNGRKKISAVIARYSPADEWNHIMISVAITPKGLQCWPVIDNIEANCTDIPFVSCFEEKLETQIGGCEEEEMEQSRMKLIPVGCATHASLFKRPLTDVECRILREDPFGGKLDPVFVASNESIYYPNSNLIPSNFIDQAVQCDMFRRITKVFFSPLQQNLDDRIILSFLGILQQLIQSNHTLEEFLTVKKLSRYLSNQEHTSYLLFRGFNSFYKTLNVESISNTFFEIIIANPFIWIKSHDQKAIFKEIKRKIEASSYSSTPRMIKSFIKVYETCEEGIAGIIEETLDLFVDKFNSDHVSLLFAESAFVGTEKLDFILSILLKTNLELLLSNPNRETFISLIHKMINNDNEEVVEKSILLFANLVKENEESFFFSMFFTFCTIERSIFINVFNKLKKEMKNYPKMVTLLFAFTAKIDEEGMIDFVLNLKPLLEDEEFKKKVIFNRKWFLFPLMLAFRLPDDRNKEAIQIIADLLLVSNNLASDVAEIHAFCEYCNKESYMRAKNVGISLLMHLLPIFKDNSHLNTQLNKSIQFSLTFQISKEECNENIEKMFGEDKETKYMSLDTPIALAKFAVNDFSAYNVVFHIILKDNEWIHKEVANEFLRSVETTTKIKGINEVIDYFANHEKEVNINKVIKKKTKEFSKKISVTITKLCADLNKSITAGMNFVTSLLHTDFSALNKARNKAVIKFKELEKGKGIRDRFYERDNTFTQMHLHNKLKRKTVFNDPYDIQKRPKKTLQHVNGLSFNCKLRRVDSYTECTFHLFSDKFIINSETKTRVLMFDFIEQFLLRDSNSFEIIMDNGKSYYLSFLPHEFQGIMQRIKEQCKFPNAIARQNTISYFVLGQTRSITNWNDYRISNFQLIIYLNHLGGRSFKCIEDYPIFPRIFDENFNILKEKPKFELEHREKLEGDFKEKFLKHDSVCPEAFFFPEMVEDYPKDRFKSAGEFVFNNRQVLESHEVNEWLPDWINEHFGIKAKHNRIISFPLKPRSRITKKAQEDKFIFENEGIAFYTTLEDNIIIVTNTGSVHLNNELIEKIEIDETCIFSEGSNFVVCYSRKQFCLWIIKDSAITKQKFYYNTHCLEVGGDNIFVSSNSTRISAIPLSTMRPSDYCNTRRKITHIFLSKVHRTFLISTDDNVLHIYSSKNKLVNEVQMNSEIKNITQSRCFGFIYIRTKDEIIALTTNGNFVSKTAFSDNAIYFDTSHNYKALDLVFCQTETRVICFSALLDKSKEVMKTTQRIITIVYNKQDSNINILFANGKVIHLPFNFM